MVDTEIVREWLAKANDDFEFAKVNLEEGKPFFAQICFHLQQAAEKYLKAYIVAHELELNQRAHSPQLAAGLASEPYKMANSLQSKIPCSLLQGASIL